MVEKNQEEDEKMKAAKERAKHIALFQGYTGEQCSNCGSMKIKRNGACTVCEDCGTTTGCS